MADLTLSEARAEARAEVARLAEPVWDEDTVTDKALVQEAAQRLEAHADYLREGPDGQEPPYYSQSASYDEDIRLVLAVVRECLHDAPAYADRLAAEWAE